MTPDERGLISAIRDDPADDAARLVYADWLEDNGRVEQAELIHVCVRLAPARRREMPHELSGRAEQLERRLSAAWPAAFEGELQWHRGMPVAKWTSCGPLSRCLNDPAATEALGRLASATLVLGNTGEDDAGVRALVESGGVEALTELTVHFGRAISAATLVELLASGNNLRSLSIRISTFGVDGTALASPHLARLRHLELWSPLGENGVEDVVNSQWLAEVQALSLIGNASGDAATASLASAMGLPKLSSLCLTNNKIDDVRLRQLLTSPLLPRLGELVLANNKIGDDGARALAGCAALSGLRSLNLSGNHIGEAAAQALLESPHLSPRIEIDLFSQANLSDETLRTLYQRFKK